MPHRAAIAADAKFEIGSRVKSQTESGRVGVVVGHDLEYEVPIVEVRWDGEADLYEYKQSELLKIQVDPIECPLSDTQLSSVEIAELDSLESKVEQAFYQAGIALREIRDRKLYRDKFKTFEEYCRQRFQVTRQAASLKILAADIVDNLSTNGCQILPTSERQVRAMSGLTPENCVTVWNKGVTESNGKAPTGAAIKGIVERLKEKPLNLASDYCEVGEIFKLQRLATPDHKYNGCWAVAMEVENRFTVKCKVYEKTLDIRQENIERIDMTETQKEMHLQIVERVSSLARHNLDPAAWALLQVLNREEHYTPLQLKLLETVEEVYKGSHDTQN